MERVPQRSPWGQRRYSDLAIVTSLTLRAVFHLPLRQTEGFVASLIGLMGLALQTPDHTTLSRRNRDVEIPRLARGHDGPLHLVIDSTGLKIFGNVGVAGSQAQKPQTSAAAGASCTWASMGMGVSSPPPSPTAARMMPLLGSRCSSRSKAPQRSSPQTEPTIRDRCTTNRRYKGPFSMDQRQRAGREPSLRTGRRRRTPAERLEKKAIDSDVISKN